MLSLGGSIDGIDSGAAGLVEAIRSSTPGDNTLLKTDTIADNLFKLRSLRPRIDPRIRPYTDAVIRFGEVVREAFLHPPISQTGKNEVGTKIDLAAHQAGEEWNKLVNDPSIREQLKN
jgi:hypothetical protein